jgi:hypothetical protein
LFRPFLHLLPFIPSIALTSPLPQGAFRVPSEDHSPSRPASRPYSVEGDGQDERQSSLKKKAMKIHTTTNSGEEAPVQSEQLGKPGLEMAKYIVIIWKGKEQILAFPNHVQHSAALEYVGKESPQAQVISAGFFIADKEVLWAGGRSETLNLDSRPKDKGLINEFLASPDRSEWDLTILTTKGGAQ